MSQDDFLQFDSLKECFVDVNILINKRNQKINDFMAELRDLEKERTKLIESCYKQNIILNIKQLSADTFQQLYEKYLKVIIILHVNLQCNTNMFIY